jgi:hypothetical protein
VVILDCPPYQEDAARAPTLNGYRGSAVARDRTGLASPIPDELSSCADELRDSLWLDSAIELPRR